MARKFQTGDAVELANSFGPPMFVECYIGDPKSTQVKCKWWSKDDEKFEFSIFAEDALMKR